MSLAFLGLIAGETKVSHLLCREHFKRTLDRKLAGDKCKRAKGHLYDALHYRKTGLGCEDSIKKAINAASENKCDYMGREWYKTRTQWANYARQHSFLFLQCLTTNAVESWHSSLKRHAERKGIYIC